ncbi:Rv1476 family membrane protein [Gordonia sp. NPDC003950]
MTPGPVADGSLILAAPVAAPASEYDSPGVTDTTAPGGIVLATIADGLRDDHVYTQNPDQVDALRAVVNHAQGQGHDINIVVLDQKMPVFTMYRDIATELQQQVGGTVLVFGPNAVGSASPEFSRVVLEESTDKLTLSNPPQAAAEMVDSITAPSLDWTLITLVLMVVVAIGAVLGRLRSLRRRADDPDHEAEVDPTPASAVAND